eukprot:11194443-Lingulodinium_polyedra.AAC.1
MAGPAAQAGAPALCRAGRKALSGTLSDVVRQSSAAPAMQSPAVSAVSSSTASPRARPRLAVQSAI